MRTAILLCLIVAAGCQRQLSARDVENRRERVERGNQARIEDRLEELAADHALTGVAALPPEVYPSELRVDPAGELIPVTELLDRPAHGPIVAEQADGSLVLMLGSRCSGQSCSCDPYATYRFARTADGKAVVIRLRYRVEVETIKRRGSCGIGCGMPAPATPPTFHALPVTRRDQVAIVDAEVRQIRLHETCDRPIPRP